MDQLDQYPATRITWLASYPRSGNTWLRFLLTNLFYTDHATQQDADFFIADDVDRQIKPKDGRPGRDFSVINPDNFLSFSSDNGELIWEDKFIRTHHTFHQVYGLTPQSVGCIYVVRHPLDVALSCLNFDLLNNSSEEFNPSEDHYLRQFIETKGASTASAQYYGIDWVSHVESWVENSAELPTLMIRYEDLLADTVRELQRICRFLSFEMSEEVIIAAVNASTFDRMKRIEEKAIQEGESGSLNNPQKFAQRHQQGLRFLHRGEAGAYADRVKREDITLAETIFSPLAQKLGYTFAYC